MSACSSRVQRLRRCEVVAERLLDDDARVLGQPCLGEPADDRGEERRRDLEVEDRELRVLDRLGDLRVRRRRPRSRRGRTRGASRGARTRPRRSSRRSRRSTRGRARRAARASSRRRRRRRWGSRGGRAASSRYSDRYVMTRARSPVIPKITSTSAGRGPPFACPFTCRAFQLPDGLHNRHRDGWIHATFASRTRPYGAVADDRGERMRRRW